MPEAFSICKCNSNHLQFAFPIKEMTLGKWQFVYSVRDNGVKGLEPKPFPVTQIIQILAIIFVMNLPQERDSMAGLILMVPWFKTTTKNNVHEFNTRQLTTEPESKRLINLLDTDIIFSKPMGPKKWRISLRIIGLLALRASKAELFPKAST